MSNNTNSASKLKIIAYNVRGLNDKIKRAEIILHLEKFNPDILCLIDTRLRPDNFVDIKNDYNYNCYFNNSDRAARGVCILINKRLPVKIENIEKDEEGNLVKVQCTYDNNTFNIFCIYGPNDDEPAFFENIFEIISRSNNPYNIIVGDYNVTLNPNIDNANYATVRNRRARAKLIELMEQHSYCDAYRKLNGNKKCYTWHNEGGRQKGRLDMAIISNSLASYLTDFQTLPSHRSDHRPILAIIDFSCFRRGKGYWKLNNALLNDYEYINIVKRTIRETCARYVLDPIYDNFYSDATEEEIREFMEKTPEELQELDFNINQNLFFEMLLNDIRNSTVAYGMRKKRERDREGEELLARFRQLQEMDNEGAEVGNLEEELGAAKNRYEEYIKDCQLKNTFIKGVRNLKEGEKPTPYLCSLEKNQSAQKYISKLKVMKNNIECTILDQKEIEKETREFYKKLYSCKDIDNSVGNIEDFLSIDNHSVPKLSQFEANTFGKQLLKDDILKTLKKTKNDTAPGLTGFTYAFYKVFWRDLGTLFTRMANFSLETGFLPESLRRGVITLLPKGNKPTDLLKNLRPVTLLPAEYKLISGTVAERINVHLPKLINEQQVGFVKGRYIGECIRTTYDTFEWANRRAKVGLLLLIDFEKAFDSISFKYIKKMLDFFGFNNDLIQWVSLLLYNFSACINMAGNLTQMFAVLRGARQGDPIASPLFVLAIEILCVKIRNSTLVKPYKIDDTEILMSLFADDMSIFLQYDDNNLRNTITILNSFYIISGIKIQVEKTQGIVFGPMPEGDRRLCHDITLTWEQDFTLLGIQFNPSLSNMEVNFDLKLNEINKTINNWKHRFLSPLGRLTIVKTLLLSKIAHVAIVLPTVSNKIIKNLESLIYSFIWGKSPNVARDDAKKTEREGGLNMPDIDASWKAFKLSWLRRLFKTKSVWGEILMANLREGVPNITIEEVFCRVGTFKLLEIRKNANLAFWSEVFYTAKNFLVDAVRDNPKLINYCYIWNSTFFMRNTVPCTRGTFRTCFGKIEYPADMLCKSDGITRFLSLEEARAKYGNIDREEYISLKYVIRVGFQKCKITPESACISRPFQPALYTVSMLNSKGCSFWTKKLKKFKTSMKIMREMENNWHECLGRVMGDNFWRSCYKRVSDIFFDNRIKIFYYYIIRGCLQTNRIIHNFVNNTSVMCTFCDSETETIMHLFWNCDYSKNFINNTLPLVFSDFPCMTANFSAINFIFGIKNERMFSPSNFCALLIKKFIWNQRCKKIRPNYVDFRRWFTSQLKLAKACYDDDERMGFLQYIRP